MKTFSFCTGIGRVQKEILFFTNPNSRSKCTFGITTLTSPSSIGPKVCHINIVAWDLIGKKIYGQIQEGDYIFFKGSLSSWIKNKCLVNEVHLDSYEKLDLLSKIYRNQDSPTRDKPFKEEM